MTLFIRLSGKLGETLGKSGPRGAERIGVLRSLNMLNRKEIVETSERSKSLLFSEFYKFLEAQKVVQRRSLNAPILHLRLNV